MRGADQHGAAGEVERQLRPGLRRQPAPPRGLRGARCDGRSGRGGVRPGHRAPGPQQLAETGQVALAVVLPHVDRQVGHPLGVLGVVGQRPGAQGAAHRGEHVVDRPRDQRAHPQRAQPGGGQVGRGGVDLAGRVAQGRVGRVHGDVGGAERGREQRSGSGPRRSTAAGRRPPGHRRPTRRPRRCRRARSRAGRRTRRARRRPRRGRRRSTRRRCRWRPSPGRPRRRIGPHDRRRSGRRGTAAGRRRPPP